MGWSEEQKKEFALTDWLLKAGAALCRKGQNLDSLDRLNTIERLLYEFWVFDMERQNGGVSQYFCNHPILEWNTLFGLTQELLPTFRAFGLTVESIVTGSADPYESVISSKIDLDHRYSEIRLPLLLELQALVQGSTFSEKDLRPD